MNLRYPQVAYRAALVDPEEADEVFAKTLEALQQEPSAAAFREARAFFAGDRAGAKGGGVGCPSLTAPRRCDPG